MVATSSCKPALRTTTTESWFSLILISLDNRLKILNLNLWRVSKLNSIRHKKNLKVFGRKLFHQRLQCRGKRCIILWSIVQCTQCCFHQKTHIPYHVTLVIFFLQKPYKRFFCNNLSLPVVTVDSFVEKTCENFPGVDRQKRHLGSQIYCDHVRGRG